MNSTDIDQNTSFENPDNNPNPYILFLILILLIMSFGTLDRMIKIIRSFLAKEEGE